MNSIPTHPLADSYISIAEANSYLANRQDAANWPTLNTAQKEALLKAATKLIDTFRFFGCKIYDRPNDYRDVQNLQFPRTGDRAYSGKVGSATENSIIDTSLSNKPNMPSDMWNKGAIVITNGTGRGQTKEISDFDAETGQITVSENWDTTPDVTSYYRIFKRIPDDVRFAVAEQAVYMSNGGGNRAKLQAEGVTEYRIGDLMEKFGGNGSSKEMQLSVEARSYLSKHITKIGRFS